MISTVSVGYEYRNGNNVTRIKGYGLSTDTKPVNVCNGSSYLEMDTGKVYFFDEAGSLWREVSTSAGIISATGVEF